jgi:uncharacterized protein
MQRSWVLALALVACRGGEHKTVVPAPVPAAVDPWARGSAASPDDPPSLVERHRFADEACPSVTGPYFFQVEKAGKTSYILGTRHVSVPLAKFPDVVRDKLRGARLAVFEVAPDDHTSIDPPAYSLSEKLGPVLWAHYGELVGKDVAHSIERGRASTALIQEMVMYEDISAMLDQEIEREVAADKIPARGLETAAFQDDLLDRLLDLRMLRVEVEQTTSRTEIEQDSHDDLAQYCAGTNETPGTDPKTRARFLRGGYTAAEIAQMDDQLVFSRNRSWIPQLDTLFADGDVFVAVGADHLIGDKSVIALLRDRGYTITRITK